jgi:alanyl-tRNA synthetase
MLNNSNEPEKVLQNLHDENFQLKKEVESLKKAQAKNLKGDLKAELKEVNGIQFLAKQVDLDANGMKDLAFQLGGEVSNLFLVLGAEINEKALLTCYIDKKLAKDKQLNAGQIVRELGKHIQGGGGGQPFFATAGGKNPEGIANAIREAIKYVS